MIVALVAAAAANEIELRLDDLQRAVNGPLTAELVGPGGRAVLRPHDDGVAPDDARGDGVYTAHATVPASSGQLVVTDGTRTWQGGFTFTPDPDGARVRLAVRLEASGLAALVRTGMAPGGGAPGGAPGAIPAGAPGGAGSGGALDAATPGGASGGGVAPGGSSGGVVPGGVALEGAPGAVAPDGPLQGSTDATPRAVAAGAGPDVEPMAGGPYAPRVVPAGMWAGWLLAAGALALLGVLAWLGGRAAARDH